MGEISAAGREQELGINQINQAVAEMDTVTQQNAALVEEAAAAAASLQEESTQLAVVMSRFVLAGTVQESRRMDGGAGRRSAQGTLRLPAA